MAWDRRYLKNWIKDRRLLDRAKNDGRLDDTRIEDAINDALEKVFLDCSLLGERRRFPLTANQWEVPIPDDINDIAKVWYIDTDGSKIPMEYMSNSQFMDNRDVDDDTSTQTSYYSYPHFQGRVLSFWAAAPPVYDYVTASWVTASRIRTVVDSGINLGRTLDGTRIKPGTVVMNLTDGSYGYVEVLDITTNKTSGTATSNTGTNLLANTAETFLTDGVEIGDIICTPSTGVVTGYAFVTSVAETSLGYEDFYSSGTAKRFASGDTYKVGKAQEIRLSEATPHPGLRDGATNDFTAGAAKATITGTTFTDTTVTGSSTSGAEAGDIAIASGGSHAYVSGVADTVLTVDKWIGGTPVAAETVTVKECDKYQVQTDFRIERIMWIGPTPSTSDTVGSESIEILCNTRPILPVVDDDPIEVPERYREALLLCLEWTASQRAGDKKSVVDNYGQTYYQIVRQYMGDIYRPPIDHIMTAWSNRRYGGRARGVRYMSANGIKWDVSDLL